MVRVLESGDEDLDAAVERATGGVVGAVRVLIGGHGLGLAVTGGVHRCGDAVLLQFAGHGVRACLGELLVEGFVRDGVGVTVDVGGGDLRVVEHVRELLEGL